MGIKESRKASFIVLAVIYVLAAAVGIGVYIAVPLSMWLKLLIADTAATVFTFVFSVVFKNASVYDPYWSVAPIVIVVALAIFESANAVKLVLVCAVCLWGVRLTANWAYTFHGLLHQDWRYTMLHDTTGIFYPVINFVGIHLVPTLVVYGAVLPACYVITATQPLNRWAMLCALICVAAAALQFFADIQMQKFRKHRGDALVGKSNFIRAGLWKHSRHPNYLGEILMWWGVGVYAVVALGFEWYYLAGALANTVLFFAVSIPMADKRNSKKEGWAEYKRETWMLLPLPKCVSKPASPAEAE